MGPASPGAVVVCDDERHIVRLVQVNLERQGYRVVPTHDGYAAVEAVHEHEAGLLVLDAGLTNPSSDWVVETLKADPQTAEVRVILLEKETDDPHSPGSGPPFITRPLPTGPAPVRG